MRKTAYDLPTIKRDVQKDVKQFSFSFYKAAGWHCASVTLLAPYQSQGRVFKLCYTIPKLPLKGSLAPLPAKLTHGKSQMIAVT